MCEKKNRQCTDSETTNHQQDHRMTNHQTIEPIDHSGDGSVLHWIKIWYTFQGEGPLIGCPSAFIRLAGCNLQCPGCDTEYTTGRKVSQIDEIIDTVKTFKNCPMVVITGGEPFRQNIVPLILRLLSHGYRVQVETNGTTFPDPEELMEQVRCLNPSPELEAELDDEDQFDPELWIVCSPKTPKVHPHAAKFVDVWKYVTEAAHIDSEGLPTRVLGKDMEVARPTNTKPVYLQPMDTTDPVKNNVNRAAVMAACQRHGYFLSIQVHKLIGVE